MVAAQRRKHATVTATVTATATADVGDGEGAAVGLLIRQLYRRRHGATVGAEVASGLVQVGPPMSRCGHWLHWLDFGVHADLRWYVAPATQHGGHAPKGVVPQDVIVEPGSLLSKVTAMSFVQDAKAESPMLLREAGSVTEARLEQPENA